MGPPPGRRSPPGTPNKDGASSSSSFAADLLRGSSSTTTATTRVLFVVVVIVITYAFLLSQPSIFVAKSGGDDRPVTAKWVRRMLNATQTQSLAYRTKLEETLAEYKTALDAIEKENDELRAHTEELNDELREGRGKTGAHERKFKTNQATLGKAILSLNAQLQAVNETLARAGMRMRGPAGASVGSRPPIPNGIIAIDVRKDGVVPTGPALTWLMNARRTTHNVPVEFWTGVSTHLDPWLEAFVNSNADWITHRTFPAKGRFEKSMRVPPSLALDDVQGAHIGKAYALAESAFSFPVFMDMDVFMCQGWWEKLMQLTAENPQADVFWTDDGYV